MNLFKDWGLELEWHAMKGLQCPKLNQSRQMKDYGAKDCSSSYPVDTVDFTSLRRRRSVYRDFTITALTKFAGIYS